MRASWLGGLVRILTGKRPSKMPPMDPLDSYLTLAQAAARLGVTSNTLLVQAHKGRLHAHRVGREWLVSVAEVERYRVISLGKPGRRKP